MRATLTSLVIRRRACVRASLNSTTIGTLNTQGVMFDVVGGVRSYDHPSCRLAARSIPRGTWHPILTPPKETAPRRATPRDLRRPAFTPPNSAPRNRPETNLSRFQTSLPSPPSLLSREFPRHLRPRVRCFCGPLSGRRPPLLAAGVCPGPRCHVRRHCPLDRPHPTHRWRNPRAEAPRCVCFPVAPCSPSSRALPPTF